MDARDECIAHWLLDVPDEEQDVGDSDSESEAEEVLHSEHDTASQIEEISNESPDYGEDDSTNQGANFYFSRHNGRNGPKQKRYKEPLSNAFRTRAHNIILHLPGVKQAAKWAKSPIECFSLFFTEDILNLLVTNTNKYIKEIKGQFQRDRDAKSTDVEEMKAFLGLLIMAGLLRASHLNYIDLWAIDGSGVEMFHLTMNYQRFLFLLRVLRFDDKATRSERQKTDNLAPIRELCDMLQTKYKEPYIPSENVTIDEQLTAFRGRFKGKVYLPSKPNKYGIIIQALVDSKTFYLLGFEVYSGKQPVGPYQVSNSPSDIVKRLVQPIKGSGRNITTDNWYTSVQLATDLLDPSYKLTFVGTLKKNKPDIPLIFLPNRTKIPTSSLFGFQKTMSMISYVPKPNKSVILLSSMHYDADIDTVSGDKNKPAIITYYNSTKGGVDTNDQLCGTYNVGRRTKRWPLALFFHFLNVTCINALVVHKANTNNVRTHVRRLFLRQLATELVESHQKRRTNVNATPKIVKRRLLEVHGLETPPAPPTTKRGRWYNCPRKSDRKVSTECSECKKFLCNEHFIVYCQNCKNDDCHSS